MIKRVLLGLAVAALAIPSAANAQTLYDNGPADFSNGFSTFSDAAVGVDRYGWDDFTVNSTAGFGWAVDGFDFDYVYGGVPGAPGANGFIVEFYQGADPLTASLVAAANVTGFTETATGDQAFSRDVYSASVDIDEISLADGDYWVRATIAGNNAGETNAFWLITGDGNTTGSEGWWQSVDTGVFDTGTNAFGVTTDYNFRLRGVEKVPEPASFAVLALGSVCLLRRRR